MNSLSHQNWLMSWLAGLVMKGTKPFVGYLLDLSCDEVTVEGSVI